MITKGFSILSKSYYGDYCLKDCSYIDEVTFGLYLEDGSTEGECVMRWHFINNELVPKLEMFSDSWILFARCEDLFLTLSKYNDEDFTVSEFVSLLKEVGFKDMTKYVKE